MATVSHMPWSLPVQLATLSSELWLHCLQVTKHKQIVCLKFEEAKLRRKRGTLSAHRLGIQYLSADTRLCVHVQVILLVLQHHV